VRRFTLRRRLTAYGCLLVGLLVTTLVFDTRCFIESRCFYFPSREVFLTPHGAQDVSIPTPDGLMLHGWYIPPRGWRSGDPPAPAVLHVHGNAGHIGVHLDFSEFLTRHGFGVLIFDYRGYGRSDLPRRWLRREDLLVDTRAALDYLLSRPDVDPARIALYGVSLGGGLALAAAAERPEPAAVVSIAAFASWRGIATTHATALAARAIKSGLDGAESITRLGDRPVLLVHGTADTIVPFRHAELLHGAAQSAGVRSELLRLPSGHNDIVVGDGAAQRQIAAFLEAALEGR
jgi:uncharacterized protein